MNYVYQIRNSINAKSYIGITNNPEIRWKGHRTCKEYGRKLYAAFKRYGCDNFTFRVLFEHENRETILKLEKFYIELFDTYKHGYNSTLGGDDTNTPEKREKLRQRMLSNNPMKDPLVREKVSITLTGKKIGPRSDEAKANIRAGKLGSRNPMFGNAQASKHLNENRVECEKCKTITNKGNYVRWHGAKCRNLAS